LALKSSSSLTKTRPALNRFFRLKSNELGKKVTKLEIRIFLLLITKIQEREIPRKNTRKRNSSKKYKREKFLSKIQEREFPQKNTRERISSKKYKKEKFLSKIQEKRDNFL
jgi:hypothetical protein